MMLSSVLYLEIKKCILKYKKIFYCPFVCHQCDVGYYVCRYLILFNKMKYIKGKVLIRKSVTSVMFLFFSFCFPSCLFSSFSSFLLFVLSFFSFFPSFLLFFFSSFLLFFFSSFLLFFFSSSFLLFFFSSFLLFFFSSFLLFFLHSCILFFFFILAYYVW
jgi:hypothetical protein